MNECADVRHARAVAAAAEALRRIRASIAADNTTVSSYTMDDRARPCCGPKEPLCRCPHQVEGFPLHMLDWGREAIEFRCD